MNRRWVSIALVPAWAVVILGCSGYYTAPIASEELEDRLLRSVHIENARLGSEVVGNSGSSIEIWYEDDFVLDRDVRWPEGVTETGRSPSISDHAPKAVAVDADGPVDPSGKPCSLSITVPTHLDGRLFPTDAGMLLADCRS